MSFIQVKGTQIQQDIASTLTAVAQVYQMSGPNRKSESAEADAFDNANAGIPKKPTGRIDGGSYTFGLFLDLGLASHQQLMVKTQTPTVETYKIINADATEVDFDGIISGPNAQWQLSDLLKADFEVEVDGDSTFPIA